MAAIRMGMNWLRTCREWLQSADCVEKLLLDLSDFGFSDFDEVLTLAENHGTDDLRITFGTGNLITIIDFRLAGFDASDVVI